MPETEWTPLHDFYAQDLDHNLTVVERYVESGDLYKIHECAQVFLTLWTTYIFHRKALNAHDRLALGRRIALDYYAVYGGLLLTGSPFV